MMFMTMISATTIAAKWTPVRRRFPGRASIVLGNGRLWRIIPMPATINAPVISAIIANAVVSNPSGHSGRDELAQNAAKAAQTSVPMPRPRRADDDVLVDAVAFMARLLLSYAAGHVVLPQRAVRMFVEVSVAGQSPASARSDDSCQQNAR